ncbi:MAG: protein translocase subunit SecF, partial [Myxococcota bacterium]|nr:protein translocase subunit SecF [Myxococcota bacterium]
AAVVAKIIKVDSIGEKVGAQLRTQGVLAILVTLGLILLYTAFRFELSFAPGAVLALLHDVLIVAGVFSVCSALFGFEFNLPTIGALMTIVGYSLNDTIVVFDRIRENVRRFKRKELSWIINTSINECLSRTLLTSATTFLVVLMLAVFGGPILRGFAVALLAGIVVGTYSSIFVASPVILFLQRWLPIQTKSAA